MKGFELTNFKDNLDNSRFRQIYTFLLNFFKLLKKEEDYENDYVISVFKLIYEYYDIILVSSKEEFIENSISNIYKKARIIELPSLNQSQSNFYFKRQISRLLSQNVGILLDLLKQEEYYEELIKIIPIILKNTNLNLKKLLSDILELYLQNFLKRDSLNRFLKPICNQIPNEVIKILIETISIVMQEQSIQNNKNIIRGLLELVNEYGDIYTEIIASQFKDLLLIWKNPKIEEQDLIISILEIICQSIEERPTLFSSFFFDILNLSNNIESYPKEVIGNYIQALKRLYYSDTQLFLKKFFNKNRADLEVLFKYMVLKIEQLNDFLLEFLIDYFEFFRVIEYDGKISKDLLELYLKSLVFLIDNNLENEYAFLSITHQLNLKKHHYNKDIEQIELKNAFKCLIKEVKDYIEIIFPQKNK